MESKKTDFPPWFQNLVLAGGATKTFLFYGGLLIAHQRGLLRHVHRYSTASAGSIPSVMLALGYTPAEMITLVLNTDMTQFNNFNVNLLMQTRKWGLNDGHLLLEWAGNVIAYRTGGNPDYTLGDLYHERGITLYMTAYDYDGEGTVFLSHHTFPEMPLRIAMRITMAYPGLMTAYEYGGVLYGDGGIGNNCPFQPEPEGFNPEVTLVFRMKKSREKVTTPMEYIMRICNGQSAELSRMRMKLARDTDRLTIVEFDQTQLHALALWHTIADKAECIWSGIDQMRLAVDAMEQRAGQSTHAAENEDVENEQNGDGERNSQDTSPLTKNRNGPQNKLKK